MNFVVRRGKLNKPLFNKKQEDYIIKNYIESKDVSMLSLSKLFGTSPQAIGKVIDSRGVTRKTLRSFRQIYELNQNYFDVIDTEQKAYWLGFLYADGVINEDENLIRINLSRVDKHHLVKFREAVGSTHPIKPTNKVTKNKTYYGSYIGFKSAHMVNKLVEKGCYQRMTLCGLFPTSDIIPEDLVRHFIRGYFDGDGSIHYTITGTGRRLYRVSIVGTLNIVDNIKYFLDSTVKTESHPNKHVIQLGGNRQCSRIFDYLYEGATVYLDRKKLIFDKMLEYIEDNPYTVWNKKPTKHNTHTNQ